MQTGDSGRRVPGKPADNNSKPAHALALAVAFAAESLLFACVTSRHYAWIYPRWYDQLQYLGQAYDGYEYMRIHGFLGAAWHTLTFHTAQGSLHAFLALLVFAVAGPSRSAALSVNLLAFLALQAATFLAVRRISGSLPMAWAAVALLAAVSSPWSGGPASAIDFRLDWLAACAFGIALAVAIAGDGFRSARWAVLFGAAAGIVILIRHLTAVYLGLIFLGLLASLLTLADRWARCARLILAAAVALAICAPDLWYSRRDIYGYYWLDQLVSPERGLRESHLGLAASADWLLRQVVFYQVGLGAVALGLGAAGALLVLGLVGKTRRKAPAAPGFPTGRAWALALAFLGAPASVPLFHPIKASQTLSMLIPGAIWIIVLTWLHLARRVARGAVAAVCAATVLLGALLFVGAETRQTVSAEKTAQFRNMNGLMDYLFFRAEEAGLYQPRVAVTWLLDGLNAKAFQVTGYERHGRRVPFVQTLPADLYATTREAVMELIAGSDFVCLVNRAAPSYPFDLQMETMRPETRRWCEANLRHAGDLEAAELSVSIYERPGLARPGRGGGAVLAEMMGAASRGPANREPAPPHPPLFVLAPLALGSTGAEFRYALAAAYSPVRYRVEALPEGLHFDPPTAEIRGRILRAGEYAARVVATNPAGSTQAELTVHVEDPAMYAVLRAPAACAVGSAAEIGYGAFDAGGKLDYVEFTDLTAGTTLGNIPAPANGKRTWQGVFRVAFSIAGPHVILLRTVCYDADRKVRYSFVDRQCEINVVP